MNGTSITGAVMLFLLLAVGMGGYLLTDKPWRPYLVRRQRRRECPCCHGYPVVWIDRCDNKYHAVLYDCAGYHEPLCIEHDKQWWRIFELEMELLR